jgi:Mn2+/Fe2+ NRAMP family transporter
MSSEQPRSFLSIIGPGILLFAAGVGAGDLLTASMAGSEVGLVVVWAAIIGTVLKWVLSEGIARWQMGSGSSMIEGWLRHAPWFAWIFLAYFVLWTFVVGGALVNACGIAATAFLPIGSESTSKIIWGIIHSLVALLLVWKGDFEQFERMMKYVIGVKFLVVILTAGLIVASDPANVLGGIFAPRMPAGVAGWSRFLGVLGGVGGTVTMLSYGYWIREAGRRGADGLRASRTDLTISYLGTALFGAAMVIIGSRIVVAGEGARVGVQLAGELGAALGAEWKWVFLVGFWATVFASLVAVWDGVPYLFADFLRARKAKAVPATTITRNPPPVWLPDTARPTLEEEADLHRSRSYRWYLVGIATVPLVLLLRPVREIQFVYATLGAWLMPVLAVALLLMNSGRAGLVGAEYRNSRVITIMLLLTIGLFVYLAIAGIRE